MKLSYKIFYLTLLITLLSGISISSTFANVEKPFLFQKKEFTKEIIKQFPLKEKGTLDIYNKYGNVNIHTWEHPEVKITVTIKVSAKNQTAANEVFERITIEFSDLPNYVSAATQIGSQSNWSSWFGKQQTTSGEFKIHYEVYMPASANLKLFNKYGDATVETLRGKADFEIKYGDLHTQDIDNEVNLQIGYGNAVLGNVKDLAVEIKYGNLNVQEAANVEMESKYSKLSIHKALDFISESKYDKYRIGTIDKYRSEGKYDHISIESVNNVQVDSRYSDYDIQNLQDMAAFEMEYGSLKIHTLHRAFEWLEMEGRYTHFSVRVMEGTEYKLDAESRYARLTYPENLVFTQLIKEGNERKVIGKIGANKQRKVIKAKLNYGGLKIKQ